MSRAELEALQLRRLRRSLSRIAHLSPAYYDRLGRPSPRALQSPADLRRLPCLEKDDLRQAYPFAYACGKRTEFLRFHMSSGTTGTPIVNPYTRADIRQWAEIMARCYRAAGVGREDVIQITPSFGLFTGGFGFHYGAEAIGAMVIPIGAGRTLLQLQLMRDMGATVIAAIASYPLRIMEVARQEGFDFKETRLRVGIFGSEIWSDELRRRIEQGMGIETFDIIGMTETGGPGLGIDCQAHQGIHVWEDHYLVEVLDPKTGQVVEDGQEGELAVTTLTRQGLPLVRYRTKDITRVLSRKRCACGRTHLRIDRLKGRVDDMIIYHGVNFYPSQVEQLLMRHDGVANDYQLVLDRSPGGVDQLSLAVEARPGLTAETHDRIRRELRDFLGFSMEVTFVPEGELERPQGKAVRVVDRRRAR
ncbi:MAG: phenylacetate--CoA ligase [Deltaproteobacteria bacterium]|nr:phenylacetate--CoA ligase [Deltaproteobacteria bacterium]